jgi:hypothetical protein
LLFARHYNGEKFRFLTLTTNKDETRTLRERKRWLFLQLRKSKKYKDLEYRATNTLEGNTVCHACVICDNYIPQPYIQKLWGSHVHISLERDIRKLLYEMSLQTDHFSYSMSRKFLPGNSMQAIDFLSTLFRGRLGKKAVIMLARRWDRPDALYKTQECCSRKDGWHCDLHNHLEVLGGRVSVNS